MRRLTASQVEHSVAEILGVSVELDVTDERIRTFESNISSAVDVASARGYLEFASAAVAGSDLSRCEDDCKDWILSEVGLGLFRRPLDDTERARYATLYDAGAESGGSREGAAWALEAMLQSPSFLYLDEGVKSDGALDDFAVASRLSLLLWGSNPDPELLAQAGRGELTSPDQVRATVARMLADARATRGFGQFVEQWLDLERLDDADQRPDVAELGAATIAALRDEPVRMFTKLLSNGAALGTLLTTTETPASPLLEPLYASDIIDRSAESFRLDPARRGGILATPGVVAALSHARRTSPTLRGKAILTSFLCAPPPPPPAGVSVTLPEVADDVSARERFQLHVADPGCAGCHRTMDGIGFSMEKLDWLGRSRDDENGHAIDDSTTFVLGGNEVAIRGTAELGQALSQSPLVAACVARNWLTYALGVPDTQAAACLVERLATEVREDRGLLRMVETALTSDWFRRGPELTP